jgi:hypothetical protein
MNEEEPVVNLSAAIYQAHKLAFKEHKGETWRRNYLTMTVPYAPLAEVRRQIEQLSNLPLKNRGEAHITVVTPTEYRILADFLPIEQINKIAVANNIQNARFKILGVGSGCKDGQNTFYLVLEAEDLLKIRHKIHVAFVRNGGAAQSFNPDHYFPHITIGFTSRDLHAADGVIKDKNSLVYDVNIFTAS